MLIAIHAKSVIGAMMISYPPTPCQAATANSHIRTFGVHCATVNVGRSCTGNHCSCVTVATEGCYRYRFGWRTRPTTPCCIATASGTTPITKTGCYSRATTGSVRRTCRSLHHCGRASVRDSPGSWTAVPSARRPPWPWRAHHTLTPFSSTNQAVARIGAFSETSTAPGATA